MAGFNGSGIKVKKSKKKCATANNLQFASQLIKSAAEGENK